MQATFIRSVLKGILTTSLLVLTLPAFSQAATGTITGSVFDSTGAVVPNVQVVITSVEQGVEYKTHSTSSGSYQIGFLPPGHYSAAAEAQGFKRLVKQGLVLSTGQTMRVDFPLELGDVTQAVQVQANNSQTLKSESSEVGQVIDFRQVQDLPLNGRNFQDLLGLSAGVTPGMQDAANGGYNFNGSRSDSNMFMIGGVDDVDNNSNLVLSPSIDAIQEIQIQTGNFSAEYGRSGGGVVQVQIRSGGNQVHGTVFEFVRNQRFDANGYFNNQAPPLPGQTGPPKQPLTRNQFGFSLGGPIKKNKLFFFGDYQGSRQTQGESAEFNVPTAQEQKGDFSDILAPGQPIYMNHFLSLFGLPPTVYPGCDLANFTPQTCQVIPASAFDAPGVAIGAGYPTPNITGIKVEGTGFIDNYFATGSSTANSDEFDVKVDFHPSDADSVSVRYSYGNNAGFLPAAFGNGEYGPCINCGIVSDLLAGPSHSRTQNAGVNLVHVFNSHTVNEFIAGLNRVSSASLTSDGGKNLAAEAGIPNVNVSPQTTGLPWFLSTSTLTFTGTSPFEPSTVGYTTYQFTDNFTHSWGRHNLKVGFDFRRRLSNGTGSEFGKGAYFFGSYFTGIDFGDFLTGRSIEILQSLLPGSLGWREADYSAYIQDDFKVSPRLTLNLGLRYDLFPPQVEAHNKTSNLIPLEGRAELAGVDGNPRSFSPTYYSNVGPHVGFAWMPVNDGKLVFRGGFAISYANVANVIGNASQNPPYTEAFTVPLNINLSTLDALYVFSDGLPIQLRPTPANFDPNNPAGSWFQIDPSKQKTPFTEYYSFGMEQLLPWNLMLDASYVGTYGHRLPGENEGDPIPPGDPATANSRHIYQATIPNVTGITLYQDIYSSHYNSLQVKLVKRFSQGLQFLGSYTWSRSIDNKSGSAVTGGGDSNPSAFPENPFNINMDRGRSSFDLNQVFSFAASYNLPFGRGQHFGAGWNRVLDGFLGNWQLNGILSLNSGLPFSVFASGSEVCGCSSSDMRADLTGMADPNLPKSKRSPNGWFNKAAFKDPQSYQVNPNTGDVTLGTYGDSGRNIIDGPGYANLDSSLFKKFNLPKNAVLQIRAEFFNTLNRTNFNYPSVSGNAIWTTGGIINTNKPPRIGQFAAKIVF